MRITKLLRSEQELIDRFLAIFGVGAVNVVQNRLVQPGFFLVGSNFIKGYIEGSYFKKEAVLLTALESKGLPTDGGPLGQMFNEQARASELSDEILNAARRWQGGDIDGRAAIAWSTSSYTSILRQHLERSRTTIFPLTDQMITTEDQFALAESINQLAFAENEVKPVEHYQKILEMLKEETDDWK